VLVMLGVIIYHVTRGEYQNIASNVVLAVLAALVAYGRWKLPPLEDRATAVA